MLNFRNVYKLYKKLPNSKETHEYDYIYTSREMLGFIFLINYLMTIFFSNVFKSTIEFVSLRLSPVYSMTNLTKKQKMYGND